jgi:hypothetical protein
MPPVYRSKEWGRELTLSALDQFTLGLLFSGGKAILIGGNTILYFF